MSNTEKEVLLRVDNLCQYFKLGHSELKAVDHVSFDIYKGEVFGLVGESGCGKTTTGRSIIKLYNITGGDIYFKGQRICAGTRQYKDAIVKDLKDCMGEIKAGFAETKQAVKEMGDAAKTQSTEVKRLKTERNKKCVDSLKKLRVGVAGEVKLIRHAKHDQKRSDNDYSKQLRAEVKKEYEPQFASVMGGIELKELKKKYRDDMRVARRTRLITQIQMIFQDPIASLDPRMTVKEIISEGLIIKGIRDKEYITKKVYEVLDLVGLVHEHAGRYPHEFSGGQRQRIGVARSIIMQPELIIADEPVSALDVSIQAQVINLLNDLRNDLGLTIMFIAHDLSVVKYFSDRIGVMYYGKLVELTTSDELFAHPLHPYTKSLLSAIPLPDPIHEKTRVRKVYNPIAEHDYSADLPSLREVSPGHFVHCNDKEFEMYKTELAGGPAAFMPDEDKHAKAKPAEETSDEAENFEEIADTVESIENGEITKDDVDVNLDTEVLSDDYNATGGNLI